VESEDVSNSDSCLDVEIIKLDDLLRSGKPGSGTASIESRQIRRL
jgi:hypothetical protein